MSSAKPKLLITGASGFLGTWLADLALANWQVYGTHRHPLGADLGAGLPGLTWMQADLADAEAVAELLDRLQPDGIAHLAAQANTTICQQDPEGTYGINVRIPEAIARECRDRQIPLLFTSTGMVFGGDRPPYAETDPVNPLNVYAQQKVEAEQRVLAVYPQAIVARLPLMFSLTPSRLGTVAPRNFMANLDEALRQRQPVQLFTDEIRSPVSAAVAAAGLRLALDWARTGRHRGLVHLGGRSPVSRYDLGVLLAQVRGYATDVIQPCRQSEVILPALRPQNVTLDSTLAFSLGYDPPELLDQLQAPSVRFSSDQADQRGLGLS